MYNKKLTVALSDKIDELKYISDTFASLGIALSTGDEPLNPFALWLPCRELQNGLDYLAVIAEKLQEGETK